MRLGVEANGGWEVDYVGQTLAEQQDWAACYDNEVTAMRAVPGAHFLFVWNPNTCTNDLGLANWYPGNAYVDIIGADAKRFFSTHDVPCLIKPCALPTIERFINSRLELLGRAPQPPASNLKSGGR